MKKLLLFLPVFAVMIVLTSAQSYNNPESIVYDEANNRYLISNKGGNSIVQLDSAGILSDFVTSGLNEPKGLLIIGDTLISVNNTSIQGFLLSDASQVVNVSITGSSFMNDATIDKNGKLYISDSNNKVIYRLDLSDGTYSTLISSGINPNGLLYNQSNNSLIICSLGLSAKIQSFNLTDSTLTTLVTTKHSDLDGLAKDNCGNIYVSSWGARSVYVFDSLFLNPPTKISSGHNGPADITINQKEQILAIPNFNSNSIKRIRLGKQCAIEINYVNPLNNSLNVNDSLQIDWDDVTGVEGYELQYSLDSTFYSSVTTVQTIGSDTIIKGLDSDTKYFWRVRTKGGEYKSIYKKNWSFTTHTISGIDEQRLNSNYSIYPNPAKDYISIIEPENSSVITHFIISDISGKVIKQGRFDSQMIKLTDINKGLYQLQLIIDDKWVEAKKIIVE